MRLLEYGARIDHRVDIGTRARVSSYRGVGRVGEKVAQFVDCRPLHGWIPVGAKGKDAPAGVGLHRVAKLHGPGVSEAHHWRRVEPRSDLKPRRKMLPERLPGEDRRLVFDRQASGVAPMLNEIALEFWRFFQR